MNPWLYLTRCWKAGHDWSIEQRCIGVELSWGGTPEPNFEWTKKCRNCGWTTRSQGYLPRALTKEYFPEGAKWPVDPESGKPLEIR